MTATTMTAVHDITPRPMGRLERLLRGAALTGWFALLLGALLGLLEARPELVSERMKVPASLLAISVIGMALIGLLVSLFARVMLRDAGIILKLITGILGVLLALITSEIVLGVMLNIPLRQALTGVRDNIEAAQILTGAFGVMIGTRLGTLGRKHSAPVPVAVQETEAPARPRRHRPPAPVRRAVRRAREVMEEAHTPPRRIEVQPRSEPVSIPKPKARKRSKMKVRLGRSVTNVCPYCLEEVQRHDPRGRVVCNVCGTPHHGDCWAITGKCEVPHLQM
jgi:uncharacterized membrane protein